MRALVLLVLMGAPLWSLGSDAPRPQPEPVGPGYVPTAYCGRVVGLTKDGMVIKPERGLKILEITPLPNGTTRERVYVQDNTLPPREFVFHDCLFPERPANNRPMVGEHRPSDVRVGDFVWISCRRFRGKDFCVRVEIQRRPGGKVPPAIDDDKTDEKYRVDTRMNARQFVEEKAAPALLKRLPRLVPRPNR